LYRTPDLVAYAKGEADITTKSDVFQLGLVLTELFTGSNPSVKPNDCLDPVKLYAIGNIPGSQGAGIAKLLKRMLVLDWNVREEIDTFSDPWAGVFWGVAAQAKRLEGKAI
jgi:hypothetical protein